MICTIKALSELATHRRESEYVNIAEMAIKAMNVRKDLTIRVAIYTVMGIIRVTGSSQDIAEIEIRASQMR